MKTERKHGHLTIRDTFPEVFDERMAKALTELADYSPEVQYLDGRQEYCAVLRWMYTENTPENAKERHELEGDTRQCQDCPHFVASKDKRVKHHACHRCDRVRREDSWCNWAYEQLDAGTLGEG